MDVETAGVVAILSEIKVPAAEMAGWDAERITRFFYGISVAMRAANDDKFEAFEALCLNLGETAQGNKDTLGLATNASSGLSCLAEAIQRRKTVHGLLSEGAGI